MKAQSSRRLFVLFGSCTVLRIVVLTICVLIAPGARAACARVQSMLEMAPQVQAIAQSTTPHGDLARCYLRYAHALFHPDEIDLVVTPDARFHDLEALGFPQGPQGLKAFRLKLNAQIPDEHGLITAMRFVGDDIIEVDIEASGTDVKTGQKVSLTIHARDRFVGDRVAERWDKVEWHTPPPKLGDTRQ